jgi:hypothetical protein
MTTTIILECRSFVATPIESGKIQLEVTEAIRKVADPEANYEASKAIARLGELLGRPVSRGNLAYWREYMYKESDLVGWAKGRSSVITA